MEKKKTQNTDDKPLVASVVAGAAVGAVGTATAQPFEVEEVEVRETPTIEKPVVAHVVHQNPQYVVVHEVSNHEEQPAPEPTEPIEPQPQPQPEDNVKVIAYERVTDPDGEEMDMALVEENGERALYVDVNLDGEANVRMADLNHDGQIEREELVNITDQHVSMQPFQEAANMPQDIYYADGTDYVNDANVDDYVTV